MSVVQTQSDYIPYDLRVRALQVEPRLDIFWQEYQARGFRYILKKYVPKMYDKNVNPFLWTIHKGYYKIKNKINWKEKSES